MVQVNTLSPHSVSAFHWPYHHSSQGHSVDFLWEKRVDRVGVAFVNMWLSSIFPSTPRAPPLAGQATSTTSRSPLFKGLLEVNKKAVRISKPPGSCDWQQDTKCQLRVYCGYLAFVRSNIDIDTFLSVYRKVDSVTSCCDRHSCLPVDIPLLIVSGYPITHCLCLFVWRGER